MADTPQHVHQILTKRPERAALYRRWPENVWLGISVGKKAAGRLLDGVEHNAFPSSLQPSVSSL